MSEAQRNGSSGFLYYTVGDTYRNKGLTSIDSLRRQMPDVPVQVHTDRPDLFESQATSVVPEATDYDKSQRIRIMQGSPFERTIFIDSDTFVVQACFDLFELLRAKELALAHTATKPGIGQDEIPEAFSGFNSGIFAYRRTAGAMAILKEWERRFLEFRDIDPQTGDEVPLRSVLYERPVDMAVLPSHYNFRIAHPQLIYDPTRVSILHGHTNDYQAVIDQLHSGANPLFYEPRPPEFVP